MNEIDRLLKQWFPVNTNVREELRNAIVTMKMEAMDRAFEDGRRVEAHVTGQLASEYAEYSLDVRQQLMERPMTYEEWAESRAMCDGNN